MRTGFICAVQSPDFCSNDSCHIIAFSNGIICKNTQIHFSQLQVSILRATIKTAIPTSSPIFIMLKPLGGNLYDHRKTRSGF